MKELSIQSVLKVYDVFHKKKWINLHEIDTSNDESYINRFCKTLEQIDEADHELVLDLLSCFQVFDISQYEQLICDAFLKAFSDFPDLKEYSKMHILPIPKGAGTQVKSQDMVHYIASDCRLRNIPEVPYSRFNFIQNLDSNLIRNINSYIKHGIILLDDFIGTGETVKTGIEHLTREGINKDKITVITMIALEAGMDYLNKYEIRASSGHIVGKGISDRYSGEEKDLKLNQMNEIEKKLRIPEKYHLGYGKSEALLKMVRTPDNTFPVFWRITELNPKPIFERKIGDEQLL